jgi:membrane protein
MTPGGFEPPTFWSEAKHSIQTKLRGRNTKRTIIAFIKLTTQRNTLNRYLFIYQQETLTYRKSTYFPKNNRKEILGNTMQIKKLMDLYDTHNISLLSAGLSFYAIFSLVPFVLIISYIAGFFIGFETATSFIAKLIENTIGTNILPMVNEFVTQMFSQTKGMFIISILLVLFSGYKLFTELRIALNSIFGVKHKRTWYTSFLITNLKSFSAALMMSGMLLFIIMLSIGWIFVSEFLRGILPITASILPKLVSCLIIWALLCFFYMYLPTAKKKFKKVFLPSVYAAIAIWIVTSIFQIIFSFATVYATLGSIAGLFLYMFMTAQIFLVGALLISKK